MEIRKEVQWFAEQMEKKLKENDHKKHWHSIKGGQLLESIRKKHHKCFYIFDDIGFQVSQSGKAKNESIDALIKECAGIANSAMMIADKVKRKKEIAK